MRDMFKGVTLSNSNYSALLTGWAALPGLQRNIRFHGGNSKYNSNAASARDKLINKYGWKFTDGQHTVLIAIIAIIILIVCLFIMFSKKPALIINKKGIRNNTSITGKSFIPWDDITGFKETDDSGIQKILLVMVNDPDKYIKKIGSSAGNMYRDYLETFGTPIVINTNNFKTENSYLINALNRDFKKYKNT